jgi:hypothetical protein
LDAYNWHLQRNSLTRVQYQEEHNIRKEREIEQAIKIEDKSEERGRESAG